MHFLSKQVSEKYLLKGVVKHSFDLIASGYSRTSCANVEWD